MERDGPTDEALLAGLAAGDELAATAFVRRYQRRIFGLAVGMVGDPALAEEIAQEAFLRVWRHAAVYDARRGAVASWVLTITRNLAVDAIRMRRSVPVDPDDFARTALVSDDRSPEEEAVTADAAPGLRRALATLPPDQRRALVLAVVHGHSAAEVSEEEGIPLGTAKTRIRAGMAKLRTAWVGGQVTR